MRAQLPAPLLKTYLAPLETNVRDRLSEDGWRRLKAGFGPRLRKV
jgi:hypothetical protein